MHSHAQPQRCLLTSRTQGHHLPPARAGQPAAALTPQSGPLCTPGPPLQQPAALHAHQHRPARAVLRHQTAARRPLSPGTPARSQQALRALGRHPSISELTPTERPVSVTSMAQSVATHASVPLTAPIPPDTAASLAARTLAAVSPRPAASEVLQKPRWTPSAQPPQAGSQRAQPAQEPAQEPAQQASRAAVQQPQQQQQQQQGKPGQHRLGADANPGPFGGPLGAQLPLPMHAGGAGKLEGSSSQGSYPCDAP